MKHPLDDWLEGVFGLTLEEDFEELTESNFIVPEASEYVDFNQDTEDICAASLWENIRKKKERMVDILPTAKAGGFLDLNRNSEQARLTFPSPRLTPQTFNVYCSIYVATN